MNEQSEPAQSTPYTSIGATEDTGDFSDAPMQDPEAEKLRCAGCSMFSEQYQLDRLGAKQS